MSAKRFLAAAIALVVLLVVAVVVLARGPETESVSRSVTPERASESSSSSSSSSSSVASPDPTTTATPDGGQDDLAAVPEDTGAADVATGFVTGWLAGPSAASATAWVDSLRPLVSGDVAAMLEATPPEALPIASVTGVAEDLGVRTPTSRSFTASLSDGELVSVRTAWDGSRWVVAQYGPATP